MTEDVLQTELNSIRERLDKLERSGTNTGVHQAYLKSKELKDLKRFAKVCVETLKRRAPEVYAEIHDRYNKLQERDQLEIEQLIRLLDDEDEL